MNLELEQFGVVELSENEQVATVGGGLWDGVIGWIVGEACKYICSGNYGNNAKPISSPYQYDSRPVSDHV